MSEESPCFAILGDRIYTTQTQTRDAALRRLERHVWLDVTFNEIPPTYNGMQACIYTGVEFEARVLDGKPYLHVGNFAQRFDYSVHVSVVGGGVDVDLIPIEGDPVYGGNA